MTMRGRLPPPDAFEPSGTPHSLQIPAPTTVFLHGDPSRASDRVADAIVAFRPGLLIVCLDG